MPISDRSVADKETGRSGEAFSLDQLARSLVPVGTQLALDRTELHGLDTLFDKKQPFITQYGTGRSEKWLSAYEQGHGGKIFGTRGKITGSRGKISGLSLGQIFRS